MTKDEILQAVHENDLAYDTEKKQVMFQVYRKYNAILNELKAECGKTKHILVTYTDLNNMAVGRQCSICGIDENDIESER